MSAGTYRIPTQFIAELQDKIAKINKKAAKIGTDLITMTLVGEPERVSATTAGNIGRMTGGKLVYEVQTVEVVGHAPVINGWEFVAVIKHRRTGNEFVVLPSVDYIDNAELEARYGHAAKNCDHCHMNRVRNATYILRSTSFQAGSIEPNDLMQVGSSCLGDFTGYNDPQAAARACENIFKMFHTIEGYSRMVPRTTKVFALDEWMAWVMQTIREDGKYVSRASGGYNSTADLSKIKIINYHNGVDTPAPTDADWDQATQVIEWVRSLEPQTDEFMHNLKVAFAADDNLTETDMGITAYAPKAMWKAQAEAVKPVSLFQGAIKEKISRYLKLERMNVSDGGIYGTSYIYNFADKAGNKYVWFASKRQDFEIGSCYRLEGTVKQHRVSTYNGDNETILTRCKVVS